MAEVGKVTEIVEFVHEGTCVNVIVFNRVFRVVGGVGGWHLDY